jgi:hypothetical protein
MPKEKFYVGLKIEDGHPVGHSFSSRAEKISFRKDESDETDKPPHNADPSEANSDFESVFDDFVPVAESYRKFIPFTLGVAPMLARQIAERQIAQFARRHGVKREDLSSANSEIFELDAKFLGDFTSRSDEVQSAISGSHCYQKSH